MKSFKDEILEYLKELSKTPRFKLFEKIGLFGSYAKNSANNFSDIDVAIKVDKTVLNKTDVWEYFNTIEELKSKLFQKFHKKSDVFDIDSHSPIKQQIEQEVIYV